MAMNQPPPSGEQPPATPEGEAPVTEGQPAEGSQQGQPPQTVEEVEAAWQHRVSQKDKAHAAAERALRDELDAVKRQLSVLTQPPAQSNGQSGTQGEDPQVQALRDELARQKREAEEATRKANLEARRQKYPSLAKRVGEAGIDIFGTTDEATLAKLNAELDDGSSGQGTFAPTSPRRPPTATAAKSLTEMNKDELEAKLRQEIERGALRRS